MNDQEIAIVFAMKGLKDTQKMKKRVTNKDYADAVKNYRVTTTGTGTAPSESAISKLLNGKSQKKIDKRKKHVEKRGRKRKVTPKELRNMITVHNRLEKNNRGKNVSARMVNENWKTEQQVSNNTISRYFRENDMPWRPVFRCQALTEEKKEDRVVWG